MKKERGCYLNFALMFLMLLAFDDSWAQKSFSKSPNIIFIIADDQGYGDLGNFFQNERAKKNITQGLDKCYTADLWTAATKKYITEHVRVKKKDSPFFLYLAFDTPHAVQELPAQKYPAGGGLRGGIQWIGKPGHFINTASGTPDSYIYPEYANATYDHDSNTTTPEVQWPEIYKRYATANRRIDDAVGDIVQLLRDLKIDSNTIIVYTSDNGPSKESYLPKDKYDPNRPTFFSSYGPFEGIKGDTWEGGIHLPAIVWGPKNISSGTKLSTPVIAYDWAPTFINIARGSPPARMDGISLLSTLTGKASQLSRPIYIEYKGEEATPDYEEFSLNRRGRTRGQMQWIRMGDYAGIRYNVKSANDDFEIYDVVSDPSQHDNLALKTQTKLLHPFPVSFTNSENAGADVSAFQSYIKDRVLQMHRPNSSAPRPYDSAYIPSIKKENVMAGVSWKIYKGSFPWIPQVNDLKPSEQRHSSFPDINPSADLNNALSFFSGYISVPKDGEYAFYMSCNAKAFLRIHDVQVIDEDYAYPGNLLRSASLFLKAGLHPFNLSYYRREDKSPAFLKLDWSSTNMPRQRMQKTAFLRDKEDNGSVKTESR